MNIVLKLFSYLLSTEHRKTVNYGLETGTSGAPTIWAKTPPEYKLASYIKEFKVKNKTWKCDICPCRLCKSFS